jgi:hypothetical protein
MAVDVPPAGHEPAQAQDSKAPVSRDSSPPQHGIEIDAATEKRLVRKLDGRLVGLAFLCYLAAFLDRSNIGNAETAGMSKDLGFDNAQYQVRQHLVSSAKCPCPVSCVLCPCSMGALEGTQRSKEWRAYKVVTD